MTAVERVRLWRLANPEKYRLQLELHKQKQATPEELAKKNAKQKVLYHSSPEYRQRCLERSKKYAQLHPDRMLAASRRSGGKHRERYNEAARQYRRVHQDKMRTKCNEWRRNNLDKVKAAARKSYYKHHDVRLQNNKNWVKTHPFEKFCIRKQSAYGSKLPQWVLDGLWLARKFRVEAA